jgi:DNA-binding NarL/FixJ family response regulator
MGPKIRMKCDTSASNVKSCCRCGTEFRTANGERICLQCRKPANLKQPLRRELTFRESQIVELVALGKANKEIAHHLLLTEGTIKEYLNRIFRKVEVPNRTALAIWEFSRKAAIVAQNGYQESAAFEERLFVV